MITTHFTDEESEAREVHVSGQGSVSGRAFICEGAHFPTLLPTPEGTFPISWEEGKKSHCCFVFIFVAGKVDFFHVSISRSFRNPVMNYFFMSFSHFSARPFIFVLSCVTPHLLQKPALCALAGVAQ